MNILLVSPTEAELHPILSKIPPGINGFHALVTGIGSTPAAIKISNFMAENKFDLVILAGICGSLSERLQIGELVIVATDSFADLGIDDNGTFIPIDQTELEPNHHPPLKAGLLEIGKYQDIKPLDGIKRVLGATLNTTLGSKAAIDQFESRSSAEIISMEGAGITYACLIRQVPIIQIRAISNRIEPRNRQNWDIPLALANLSDTVSQLIIFLASSQYLPKLFK